MDKQQLLALAERVEQASRTQQADIICEAWGLIAPTLPKAKIAKWARKFGLCIDAEAFESAAIMLVPDGFTWAAGTCGEYDGPWACVTENAEPCRDFTPQNEAATPALALTAAALRAIAEGIGDE